MKHKTIKIKPIGLALLLAGIGLAPAAYAVDLVAIEGQWSPDGGTTQIPMWGFARDTGQACNSLPAWDVGPQLKDTGLVPDVVTGDLTINLRNCLGEGVSLVIPGKPATSCNTPAVACAPVIKTDFLDPDGNPDNRPRVTAFTTEATANGGTVIYTFTGIGDGTYLYQSGSHPAKQVQMGLYGALTIKGSSYPDSHDEVTLLYSEIDPELHTPTPKAATPLGYHPRHYLVNGLTSASFPTAGDTNHPTLLRFLNAGLDFHVPALNSGYMSLVAEDGNAYPFPKQQYSVNLAAGKTIDALWHAPADGDYVIYDRRGNGMISTLTVAAGPGQPIANDDSYMIGEDGTLNIATLGVLANDTSALPLLTPLTVPPSSASLVSSTSSGTLSLGLAGEGSFTYTPNAHFNGTDVFTYRANDGTLDSNVASVTITVNPGNDKPVADANGPYTATVDVPVTLDGTGSSDIDVGDTLTYEWDFDYDGITFNVDGNGSMPVTTYTATGIYTVALVVNDGTEDSDVAETTVDVGVAVNTAPVAVEDFATVQRNSAAAFINLSLNDSDVDINLCIDPTVIPPDDNSILCNDPIAILSAAQFTITTGSTTTRGGSVTVVDNGVNYTPKRNFRGTDTFSYTVADLDDAVSNEVTVRINVVK